MQGRHPEQGLRSIAEGWWVEEEALCPAGVQAGGAADKGI